MFISRTVSLQYFVTNSLIWCGIWNYVFNEREIKQLYEWAQKKVLWGGSIRVRAHFCPLLHFSSVVPGRNNSHFMTKRSSALRIHCDAHTHTLSMAFVTNRKIAFTFQILFDHSEKCWVQSFPTSLCCRKIHPQKTELSPRKLPSF